MDFWRHHRDGYMALIYLKYQLQHQVMFFFDAKTLQIMAFMCLIVIFSPYFVNSFVSAVLAANINHQFITKYQIIMIQIS